MGGAPEPWQHSVRLAHRSPHGLIVRRGTLFRSVIVAARPVGPAKSTVEAGAASAPGLSDCHVCSPAPTPFPRVARPRCQRDGARSRLASTCVPAEVHGRPCAPHATRSRIRHPTPPHCKTIRHRVPLADGVRNTGVRDGLPIAGAPLSCAAPCPSIGERGAGIRRFRAPPAVTYRQDRDQS